MDQNQRDTRLVRIALFALRAARERVSAYGSIKIRNDFTRPRLDARLVLKASMRNDCRGVCELLTRSPPLSDTIGMTKNLHFIAL